MAVPGRLLAIDIDGTLVRSDFSISPRTLRALRLATRSGVIVCLATGRPLNSALRFRREIGSTGPIVVLDGAAALSAAGEVLEQRPLDPGLVKGIAALALRERQGVAVQTLERVYLSRRRRVHLMATHWLHHRMAVHWNGWRHAFWDLRQRRTTLRRPSDLDAVAGPLVKVSIFGPFGPVTRVRAEIVRRFPAGYRFTLPEEAGTEIVAEGTSKASGIEAVLRHLGLGWEDVVAVGDNWNDREMIARAGLGVAMGNAPAPIRAQAAHVTGSVDEDGLADVVEKILAGLPLPGASARR